MVAHQRMGHIQEAAPIRPVEVGVLGIIGVRTTIVIDIIAESLDLSTGVGG